MSIDTGRARPPYEPRSLQCPACAAPLIVRDERSRFAVCDACDTELELSDAAAVALGKRDGEAPELHLDIGHSVRWEDHRYEVCARLVHTEFDSAEATLEYLLYSPRRGSLWLSVYDGRWSIARKTHLMLAGNAFVASNGAAMHSHDGRLWKVVETGDMRLDYVDGALPWVARRGDQVEYADLRGTGHEEFQVQRRDDELEFFEGRALDIREVREATGLPELPGHRLPKLETKGRSWLRVAAVMLVCVVTGLWSFGLMVWAAGAGEEVLQEFIAQEQLVDPESGSATEVYTQPFTVSAAGNLLEVRLHTDSLDNEWLAVDMALVKDGETVVHVFDQEVSRYSGVDYEGYYWEEDDQSAVTTFTVPEAGSYQLLLRAVSGVGETPNARRSNHAVLVEARDGVRHMGWPMLGVLASGIVFVIALLLGIVRLGER